MRREDRGPEAGSDPVVPAALDVVLDAAAHEGEDLAVLGRHREVGLLEVEQLRHLVVVFDPSTKGCRERKKKGGGGGEKTGKREIEAKQTEQPYIYRIRHLPGLARYFTYCICRTFVCARSTSKRVSKYLSWSYRVLSWYSCTRRPWHPLAGQATPITPVLRVRSPHELCRRN